MHSGITIIQAVYVIGPIGPISSALCNPGRELSSFPHRPLTYDHAAQVRAMPLEQFKQEFGGDIAAAVLQDLDKRLAAGKPGGPGPPATAFRGLRQRGLVAETPALACTTRKRKAVDAHEGVRAHVQGLVKNWVTTFQGEYVFVGPVARKSVSFTCLKCERT
jgi:hypothetical protein